MEDDTVKGIRVGIMFPSTSSDFEQKIYPLDLSVMKVSVSGKTSICHVLKSLLLLFCCVMKLFLLLRNSQVIKTS